MLKWHLLGTKKDEQEETDMKTHCLDSDTEGGLCFLFPYMVWVLAKHILSSLKVGYLRNWRHQYFWFSHKEVMEHSLRNLRTIPWVLGSGGLRTTQPWPSPSPQIQDKICHSKWKCNQWHIQGTVWFAWLFLLGAFYYLVCAIFKKSKPPSSMNQVVLDETWRPHMNSCLI